MDTIVFVIRFISTSYDLLWNGNPDYDGVKQQSGNFINNFYDDMQWMGLAMLRTCKATNDEKFKTAVRETLWPDIKGGWTDVAGGGIMWAKHTPHDKNACSNGPASILAAKLYQMDQNQDDLYWAKKIFEWQKDHLVDPASGEVWDHITLNSNGTMSITKWPFTYKQGTYLGAALKLYNITGEREYLNKAVKAADYNLNNLTDSGLLQPNARGDAALFKAIFVRYFTQLIMEKDLSESNRNWYINSLRYDAEMLWNKGTNTTNNTFGTFWATKPGEKASLNAGLVESL